MICIQSASTTPGLLQHSLPQHVISLNTWRPPHPQMSPSISSYPSFTPVEPPLGGEAGLPKGQLSDGINLQPTPPLSPHSTGTAQALSQHRHLGTLIAKYRHLGTIIAKHRHTHNHQQQAALQPNLPECAATNFTEAKAEAQTCVKEEHRSCRTPAPIPKIHH